MNLKLSSPVSLVLLAAISLTALTTSCKKSSDVKAVKHDTTIYMAGYVGNTALYTKNDTVVNLSSGSYPYSSTRDILVSGSDLYVGGYVSDDDYTHACYWKNGQLVVLGTSNTYSQVYAIAVSGSDVYAVGYQYDASWNVHTALWKNGTLSLLDSVSDYCYATSIAISGSDVYIGGYKYGKSDAIGHALYYKNGVENLIDTYAEVNAIAVSGSNVYCAGDNWKDNTVATYYKNGVASYLADGSDYSAYKAVAISGSDVYIAGQTFVNSTGKYSLKYWKNGTAVTLYEDLISAEVNDLAVVGPAVYSVGYVDSKEGTDYGTYWKDQTRISVSGVDYFTAIYAQMN